MLPLQGQAQERRIRLDQRHRPSIHRPAQPPLRSGHRAAPNGWDDLTSATCKKLTAVVRIDPTRCHFPPRATRGRNARVSERRPMSAPSGASLVRRTSSEPGSMSAGDGPHALSVRGRSLARRPKSRSPPAQVPGKASRTAWRRRPHLRCCRRRAHPSSCCIRPAGRCPWRARW